MTTRSIPTKLRDTAIVVEDLRIAKAEIISINVYAYPEVSVFVKPAAFVRLFNLTKGKHRKMNFDERGNLHADFFHKRTRITTMLRAGTPELTALMSTQQKIAGKGQLLLESAAGR